MLRELRVSEMRYRAVLEVLDGAVISAVARRYGVSRQTVHTWLRRYAAEGAVPPRATNPLPATPPAVPTDERLSLAMDQGTRSGQLNSLSGEPVWPSVTCLARCAADRGNS
jgi:transposase-like protein